MHHHTMSVTCHHASRLQDGMLIASAQHMAPTTASPSKASQHMQDEGMRRKPEALLTGSGG